MAQQSPEGNTKPNRWSQTWAYQRAKRLAIGLLEGKDNLTGFLQKVSGKLEGGALSEYTGRVGAAVRLIRAYIKGEYREIPKEKIGLLLAALVYFVMPIDGLPDFIAMLGLVDDAALLAWTFGVVGDEIERFEEWEKSES